MTSSAICTEQLVLAPERVDDVGLRRVQRRLEATPSRDRADDGPQAGLRLRRRGLQQARVEGGGEVGEVAQREDVAQRPGVQRGHLAAVPSGGSEHQVGPGHHRGRQLPGQEGLGVQTPGRRLRRGPLVHRLAGQRAGAGAGHSDAHRAVRAVGVQLALEGELEEG